MSSGELSIYLIGVQIPYFSLGMRLRDHVMV
jgi:hypothetical protein